MLWYQIIFFKMEYASPANHHSHFVFEICKRTNRTDRLTDRRTDILITRLHTPPESKVKSVNTLLDSYTQNIPALYMHRSPHRKLKK